MLTQAQRFCFPRAWCALGYYTRRSRGSCSEIVLENGKIPWPSSKHEWDFLDPYVCIFKIYSTKKFAVSSPFFSLVSQAAKVGLRHWSSSTGFCAVASSRTWTKAPCPAPTAHSMARQCPCQHWMSPAPPPRSENSSSKWPRQISASLAFGCTSSSQAHKPHSALGPFCNAHSLLTQLCSDNSIPHTSLFNKAARFKDASQ